MAILIAITGGSGSGKSTLLKGIAGVLAPEPPTTIRDERPGRAMPPRR